MQQATNPQTCKTSSFVQEIGKTLAKMNNAELQYIKALTKSWRDAAASIERMADLLVDGGLLLHYVRLVSTTPLNTTLSKKDFGPSVPEGLALIEAPLKEALRGHAGDFIQQVNRAFDMSQWLSLMFTDGMFEPPMAELQSFRDSWGVAPGGAPRRP